ncbi:polyprenol monophosphomannose synthase [Microcystis aeruginosa NIES-2519]|jgi:dolichol-phosphate mannosyltransferase|uniref:Dolichol-phosphate mannosyltransferase n=1 Tax=Microcystis aeruginosa NIES-2519 TaxID=2303981 RepID=A0A5A5RBI6_MICAE|nr:MULTISPECIES: glycosyltransferase [Microcystis]AVQ71265.1 sulfonate ABC transporter permease [Microcystis sp. MC19]GCA69736.1 polyprenol monophosphomannose synthase [Microcystis aeruginosa NIES-2519]GCA90678.1 polyprenol monophosphomannose synthase [Microcystis aeruginosa NIES-4264]
MTIPQIPSLLPCPNGPLQVPFSTPFGETNGQEDGRLENSLPRPLSLSLIIPTYNEKPNIISLIAILDDLLAQTLPEDYQLILVDDDSPDRTWEIAATLMTHYPRLRVMRRQGEKGLSSAVVRGWQLAEGEILGVIDADLQHPPEILLQLLGQIQAGADLAVASRHLAGGGVSEWSLTRRFLSRGAQLLGLLILPSVVGRVSDPMSGYFMVRRSAIAGPVLNPMGYKILLEVIGRGQIRTIAEVGYVFQERQQGESKVTWKQYIEYVLHLLKLRSKGGFVRLEGQFPLDRFLRFCVVGLSGVFVDMAIFYLLSDPSTLAWGVTRSKIIAAEVAIINNFLWNDRWTFGDLSTGQNQWQQRLKRFLKFNLICLAGLLLNVLLLNFFFNVLHINRYIANLIAIAMVTIWNFWINLKLSWRVTEVKLDPPPEK